MKIKSSIIIVAHFTLISYCQNPTLSKDLDFKNGFYLSHKDFATNNPSLRLHEIRFTEKSSYYSFQKIFKDFIPGINIQINLDTVQIWGMCIDGTPFFNLKNYSDPNDYLDKRESQIFIKPMFIGNICLFTSERDKSSWGYKGPYYNKTEIDQYLLKSTTGEIKKLKPDFFLDFIQDDSDFYTEYNSLSRGKKKDELIRYLLKYNRNNPITMHCQ